MADRQNPFTPSFGSIPPVFAGRKYVIKEILSGLQSGPGNPNRASLLVGARGSGKTALLAKVAKEAGQYGWVSVRITAVSGMLEDILIQSRRNGDAFLTKEARSHLTSIGVAGLSAGRQLTEKPLTNWRAQMEDLVDELAQHSVGLFITVDEIKNTDDMRILAATFQHFVSEEKKVALLMAGLPQNVSSLLSDETVSFLRRSVQHQLGPIHEPHEVREVIRKTIELSGRSIDEVALKEAALATGGFPFLIQLVGYHIWRQNPLADTIEKRDVKEGVLYAQEDMEGRILRLTVRELSDGDLQFLLAMLEDENESQIADIAKRLEVSSSHAGQYRLRLIEQGIIGGRGRGKVGFDLPMLKDYLRRTYLN